MRKIWREVTRKMQKFLKTADIADRAKLETQQETKAARVFLNRVRSGSIFVSFVSFCKKRNPIRRARSVSAVDGLSRGERSRLPIRVIRAIRGGFYFGAGFTAAFPRKVFGSADHSGANRTLDRVAAAQE